MKRNIKVGLLAFFIPLSVLISSGGKLNETLVVFIGNTIYFLPTFVALQSKKLNTKAIFTLNLLLGWSVIGWIVSLVWATTRETPAAPKQ